MPAPIPIRRLEPTDTEALLDCFARCYAGTYPDPAFQDARALTRLVEQGLLRSVIAVEESGDVVGHMGLRLRRADAIAAVAGNTVVDPRRRGDHLAAYLGAALMKLAVETGLVGTHGYPTTAHPVIQKLEVQGGGFETGVLLDYIPAETDYVGISEGRRRERLAVAVVYRPLATHPPREIHLPERHRERLRDLYRVMGLPRSFPSAPQTAIPDESALSSALHAGRGLLHIEITRAGSDLAPRMAAALAEHDPEVTLIDVSLADSGANAATEALARHGFYFGALLPEIGPYGDALRLQRAAPPTTAPNLANDDAKNLLAYALEDRARASLPQGDAGTSEG